MSEEGNEYILKTDPDFQKTSDHNIESQPSKDQNCSEFLSLDNYPAQEAKRLIDSPRSIEACRMEGILPEELLYKGMQEFYMAGKPYEVQKMRYERFEKKRKELLQIARESRKRLIANIESRNRSNSEHLLRVQSNESLDHPRTAMKMSRVSGNDKEAFTCAGSTMGVREDFAEIVKRAKERELRLMTKMLTVEEQKNKKNEEHEMQLIALEESKKREDERRKKMLKVKLKEKMNEDMRKLAEKREEERQKRKEAEEQAHQEIIRQEKERQDAEKREQQRREEMAEKEHLRKEKVKKAAEQREMEQAIQEEKLRKIYEKTMERERMIRKQKLMQQKEADRKRKQFEKIKEKVRQNIESEEQRKLQEFIERQHKKEEQERKIYQKQQQFIRLLKEKSDQRNDKIQNTVYESNKRLEERKSVILNKQLLLEQRLAEQKRKKEQQDALRQEDIEIRNEIKRQNSERRLRKEHYKIAQIKEKQEMDEARKIAFIKAKEELKDMRLKNQAEAALQRERIRSALHNMAVWNVWDMGVVKDIIIAPEKLKDHTIDELVRIRSSMANAHKKSLNFKSFVSASGKLIKPGSARNLNRPEILKGLSNRTAVKHKNEDRLTEATTNKKAESVSVVEPKKDEEYKAEFES